MFHCRTLALVCFSCLCIFIPVKAYPSGAYNLENTNSEYEKREEPWTSFKFERRSHSYGLNRRSSDSDNEKSYHDDDGYLNTKPWRLPKYFSYFHTPKEIKAAKRASLGDFARKWRMENLASAYHTR